MQALFITGTDTGVGKTQTACLIARQAAAAGLRVGAYKPVCSGAEHGPNGQFVWEDVQRLAAAINVPATHDEICPQRFLAPLAPPIAARREGRTVDAGRLRSGLDAWRDRVDLLLIEGAGGFLCPVTDSMSIADLAQEFGFPLILAARPGLGTINHTLLTIEAARRRNLRVMGVILCETANDQEDASIEGNPAEIESRGGVPVFGTIPLGNLAELLHRGKPVSVNWELLAKG